MGWDIEEAFIDEQPYVVAGMREELGEGCVT